LGGQIGVEILEPGTVRGRPLPALEHQAVHSVRTFRRAIHSETLQKKLEENCKAKFICVNLNTLKLEIVKFPGKWLVKNLFYLVTAIRLKFD
jgi:hypothetical protein